ncbi:hypothetical protein ACSHWG_01120 [Leucobacter sp. Z1108]|uniref:hypothetical protein n=1 Tax=Leucobacter sp. Z1108 TaxID=3439066 RepID=UPI003F3B65C6
MLRNLLGKIGYVPAEVVNVAVRDAAAKAQLEADRERSRRALAEDEVALLRAELAGKVTPVKQELTNAQRQVLLNSRLHTLRETVLA